MKRLRICLLQVMDFLLPFSFRLAACWCQWFYFSVCCLWNQQLLKVHFLLTDYTKFSEKDFACLLQNMDLYFLMIYFGFVLQWVSMVKRLCFPPSLIPALLNSLLKSRWVFQHLHSACELQRSSRTRGRSFSLPIVRPSLMKLMCGNRQTVVCPCIFSLVMMEHFSDCLLSPPSRPTCASPGTLRLVSLPSGWMDIAVCSSCIEQVSQSVLAAPSCSAKTLINIWVALMRSRVL